MRARSTGPVAASLAVHGLLALAALRVTIDRRPEEPQAITVVTVETAPDRAAPQPTPVPPPRAQSPAPAPRAPARPRPAPPRATNVASSSSTARPVDTGLTFSNSGEAKGGGPGVEVPKGEPHGVGPRGAHGVPSPNGDGASDGQGTPGGGTGGTGECAEAPTRPAPLVRTTEIEYTEQARASDVEGRLVLRITVDQKGDVTDVAVVSPVDPGLDAAAIAAVKTWRFKPAQRCGKPIAGGVYTLARIFELGD